MRSSKSRVILGLLAILTGSSCRALWNSTLSLEPENCVANPTACTAGQRCDPVTEICVSDSMSIESVSPRRVPRSGGMRLTLHGTGFTPGMTVEIAGTQLSAAQVEVLSGNELHVLAPPNQRVCGLVPVTLRSPTGTTVSRRDLLSYSFSSFRLGTPVRLAAATSAGSAHFVDTADLNQDGRPDVVAVMNAEPDASRSTLAAFLGNGDGSFATFSSAPTGEKVFSFTVMDWDRDGRQDVLAAALGGKLIWLRGQGGGKLSRVSPNYDPQMGAFTAIFPLDLGADQPPTLLALGDALIRLQNRDGQIQKMPGPESGPGGNLAAMGDLNQDGRLDVVRAYYNLGHPPDFFLGSDQGTFQAAVPLPVTGAYVGAAVADLDGDGWPDVVLASPYSGGLTVLMNRRDASFALPRFVGSERARMVRLADMDCDGLPDAVVANEVLTYGSLFLNQGDGMLSAPQFVRLPAAGLSVVVSDLDGDAAPDLIFGMSGTTDIAVVMNTSQ